MRSNKTLHEITDQVIDLLDKNHLDPIEELAILDEIKFVIQINLNLKAIKNRLGID